MFNPLPYRLEKELDVEFQLENQNWNEDETTVAYVRDENENPLAAQNEKEDCSKNLDWRKKVACRAVLEPMQVNRFNCRLEVKKNYVRIAKPDETDRHFCVQNERMSVKISKLTGLIDEYTVDGKARLKSGRGLLKCFPIMKICGE